MSDNLTVWLDDYRREVDKFLELLNSLKTITNKDSSAFDKAVRECLVQINHINDIKKSFNLEVKLIRDRASRTEYEAKFREIELHFNDLNKEYNIEKQNNDKKALFAESARAILYSTEGKDNEALLGEAHHIQDLTFASLGRTRQMIEESKDVGAATLEQLRGQKEQIIEIEKEIDNMDSNLVRAEKLIFNFTRRMATDRIIQMFAAINIVVMLGLILYVALSGKSLSPSSGSGSSIFGPSSLKPTRMPSFRPSILPTLAPTFEPS